MILSLLLGIFLGGISVLFILQNVSIVTITFLYWQFEGSMALVLLLALVVGSIITLLFLLPSLIRDMFYLSALKKANKTLADDLVQTRCTLSDVSSGPHGSGAGVVETI